MYNEQNPERWAKYDYFVIVVETKLKVIAN